MYSLVSKLSDIYKRFNEPSDVHRGRTRAVTGPEGPNRSAESAVPVATTAAVESSGVRPARGTDTRCQLAVGTLPDEVDFEVGAE